MPLMIFSKQLKRESSPCFTFTPGRFLKAILDGYLWSRRPLKEDLELQERLKSPFFTDAETSTVLAQWFKWVQAVVGDLLVDQIMIDCSQTKISVIREAFGDNATLSYGFRGL